MLIKEIDLLFETAQESKEISDLTSLIDSYIKTIQFPPGAVFKVRDIPGIENFNWSDDVQSLVDVTRIYSMETENVKGGNIAGQAHSYYKTDQGQDYKTTRKDPAGNVKSAPKYAYDDARWAREFQKDPLYAQMSPEDQKSIRQFIGTQGKSGMYLDIGVDMNLKGHRIDSTLSHELMHHFDSIKGRFNSKSWQKAHDRYTAQQYLNKHEQAKKQVTTQNPNPEGLLTPEQEKQVKDVLKNNSTAKFRSRGAGLSYYKEPTEVNARLMQVIHDLADDMSTLTKLPKMIASDNQALDKWLRMYFTQYELIMPFLAKTDADFNAYKASHQSGSNLGAITDAEWAKVKTVPEFQRIYSRAVKFLDYELGPQGGLFQQGKEGFKNWNTAVQSGVSAKETFIKRFTDYLIKGVDVLKGAAVQAVRYKHLMESELRQLLTSMLPKMALKGTFESIPLAGLLIGVGFGISRLIDRDVIGAGLEVVGGVASLATAIPLTAYTTARDMYGQYYSYADTGRPAVLETDLVRDPNSTNQRISELKDVIAAELKRLMDEHAQQYMKSARHQGAVNARDALRNYSTAGNPAPNPTTPTPQQPTGQFQNNPLRESLERIVYLTKFNG